MPFVKVGKVAAVKPTITTVKPKVILTSSYSPEYMYQQSTQAPLASQYQSTVTTVKPQLVIPLVDDKKLQKVVKKLKEDSRKYIRDNSGYGYIMGFYKGARFGEVNRPLQTGQQPPRDIMATAALLQKFLVEGPRLSDDITVYRGVEKQRVFVKDDLIENPMPLSTTTDMSVARAFMGVSKCCLLELSLPKGAPAFLLQALYADAQHQDPEKEILLPAGTTFVVTDIRHDPKFNKDVISARCVACDPKQLFQGMPKVRALYQMTVHRKYGEDDKSFETKLWRMSVVRDYLYTKLLTPLFIQDYDKAKKIVQLQMNYFGPNDKNLFKDYFDYITYLLANMPASEAKHFFFMFPKNVLKRWNTELVQYLNETRKGTELDDYLQSLKEAMK